MGDAYVKPIIRTRPRLRDYRLGTGVRVTSHPYHVRVTPPEQTMSGPDARSVRSNWESEIRLAEVYEALAHVTSDVHLKHRLTSLAATEKRHADAWASLLGSGAVKVPDRRPQLTAQLLAALARVAGIGPALALAGAAEGVVLRSYLSQVSTVADERAQGVLRQVLPEELDHQSAEGVTGDSPESKAAVEEATDGASRPVEEDWHGGGVESIRNVIYGVNDGLTATLGVLAGVGGASVNPRVVLIGGLSAMVASGVSMAGGAYLASKSQREVFEGQLAREAAEIEAMPDLERAELVQIYRSKGLTPDEAATIVGRITSDKKVWLETQAREELGLDVNQFENPTREGVVAGISTLVGGAIPVAGYLLGRLLLGTRINGFAALVVAFAVSAGFLFVIGSARSFFTGKGGVRSGIEMLVVGSVVAAITYGVGLLFRA
jgi:vacuolar iron transporter family protein